MPELAAGPHRGAVLSIAALLILLEALWLRLRGGTPYDWRETGVSALVMAGQFVSRVPAALVIAPVMLWVYRHRLFEIQTRGAVALAGLFIGAEFLYYWFHRLSHRVRWLWATHAVHHSSTRLNLSAAVRLGWTGALSGGWLLFTPLVWIGYPPPAVTGMLAANLTFQFLLHTELLPRLGPLEWVFNTPSHHRVHHAANADLLDRNFGGVLIVFDRLFGTHADEPRDMPLRYGWASGPPATKPIAIAFGEWRRIFGELAHCASAHDVWGAVVGRR
jgi:sterol desaturase/sphingolipid hydroxylase (fatty acid hydroxylase superfamily)